MNRFSFPYRALVAASALLAAPLLAGAGCGSSSGGSGTAAQTGTDGGACVPADCAGLAATEEAKLCADGTGLGRTVCTRESSGLCAWDFPACPVSGDAGASDAATGDASARDAGGACSSDDDCATGAGCGFLLAEACAATGTCVVAQEVRCEAYSVGCGCDGTPVNVACTGLPSGYEHAAVLHTGPCAGDGG